MKKTLVIVTLVLVLVLTGCQTKLKTNYIRPVEFTEDEKQLMELVAPQDYVLLEYEASDYKSLFVSFEKYEYGEMVGEPIKPGIICDDDLGSGKIYLGIDDEHGNLHLVIQGIATTDFPIEIDEKYIQSLYTRLDREVSIKENSEVIIYFKRYEDDTVNAVSGYNVEHFTVENITDYQFCYRIVVSFQ